MAHGPLVTEQIEAGARFLQAFNRYAPIQAAFWLQEYDSRKWYLYIVSDQIDDANLSAAH